MTAMTARKSAAKPSVKSAAKPSTKSPAKSSVKPAAGKTGTKRAPARRPFKRVLPGDGVSLYSVEEAADRLRVGRTLVYYLVGKGKIDSLKIEGLRRIPREALEKYVADQLALTSRLGA